MTQRSTMPVYSISILDPSLACTQHSRLWEMKSVECHATQAVREVHAVSEAHVRIVVWSCRGYGAYALCTADLYCMHSPFKGRVTCMQASAKLDTVYTQYAHSNCMNNNIVETGNTFSTYFPCGRHSVRLAALKCMA
jgi:hypothetical protein